MRVKHVVGGLMALACVYMPSTEASRWTKPKRRQEEDKQPERMDDPLGLTRKHSRPAANPEPAFDFKALASQFGGNGGADFDLSALMKTAIDGIVERLEDASQRATIKRDELIEILQQIPADTSDIPGLEAGVSAVIENLQQVDDKQLQQEVDKVIDGLLQHIKQVQKQLEQPGGLQTLLTSNLKAAGLSDSEILQFQELLDNPQSLVDAMQEMLGDITPEDMVEAAKQLMDVNEDDLEALQKTLADPDAMAGILENLFEDEDMKAAMEGVDVKELEALYANLAKDPEIQAALGGAMGSGKKEKGNKRGAEDVLKRTGRRQRA